MQAINTSPAKPFKIESNSPLSPQPSTATPTFTTMAQAGCCVFLGHSRSGGYRALSSATAGGYDSDSDDETSAVTVVVGKDRRVFLVEPFVLEAAPIRILVEMVGDRDRKRRRRRDEVIFLDVEAILFEHMLWIVYNDCRQSSGADSSYSSDLLQLNLKEIIDFYSQDS